MIKSWYVRNLGRYPKINTIVKSSHLPILFQQSRPYLLHRTNLSYPLENQSQVLTYLRGEKSVHFIYSDVSEFVPLSGLYYCTSVTLNQQGILFILHQVLFILLKTKNGPFTRKEEHREKGIFCKNIISCTDTFFSHLSFLCLPLHYGWVCWLL